MLDWESRVWRFEFQELRAFRVYLFEVFGFWWFILCSGMSVFRTDDFACLMTGVVGSIGVGGVSDLSLWFIYCL